MAYSRVFLVNNDAEQYLKQSTENYEAALQISDPRLQGDAHAWFVDALGTAGTMTKTLEMADEGLVRFPEHTLCHAMCSFWRGACLTFMARPSDAIEELERCFRFCRDKNVQELASYAMHFVALSNHYLGDAGRTLDAAKTLEAYSHSLGEPPLLVALARTSFAAAQLMAGRQTDALESIREAIDIFRRVESQVVEFAVWLMGEALLALGDYTGALAASEEAIAVGRRGLGHSTKAIALLRRDGKDAADLARAELSVAAELIRGRGLHTMEPELCQWQAELARVLGDRAAEVKLLKQARQGYEGMGAPLQVARLDKLLAELS
jgi:tetratricopeptide (TPR) repeat protein